jgi:NADPH:quinone reductase-like Zn-dependent oxidoreductase
VGQRVFGLSDSYRGGTLAEYVAVEARNLAPLPGDVDFTVGASGGAMQSEFVQTDDAAAIQQKYGEWEPKVEKFLSDNLGVTYLVEFTTVHGGAGMPSNHSAAGGAVWAEILAKNAALTSILQELRRC